MMFLAGPMAERAGVALPGWIKLPRVLRDLAGLPPLLAQSGPLELRLATTKKEIRRAQRLRYRTFFTEGGAIPAPRDALVRRDRCAFDHVCDHLLVVDRSVARARDGVVGTYRLLRSDVASAHHGFYSQAEFDLAPLLARHPDKRFLELGRSCVHAAYRSKRVIDLLWRGIGVYAMHHRIDVLIGCASLPGTDPARLAQPLGLLLHSAAAAPEWQVRAHRGLSADAVDPTGLDERRALASLPPLIKAYLRTGARFGPEAVVDLQFGTTDVFAVLPFAGADARYMAHFGAADLVPAAVAPRH